MSDKDSTDAAPAAPVAAPYKLRACEIASNLIFALLVGLLYIFLWGDPLLNREVTILHQISTISRNRDILGMKITGSEVTEPVRAFGGQEIKETDTVYKHIDTYILPETPAKGSENFNMQLTPLQASMVMMGCYGYPHKLPSQGSEFKNIHYIFGQAWANNPWLKKFHINFLLQAYEDIIQESSTTVGGHVNGASRSACACLKDFANPNLFHLGNLKNGSDMIAVPNTAKDVTCEHRQYMHSACTIQRALDYTIDGDPAKFEIAPINNAIFNDMLLLQPANQTYSKTRHQPDPFYESLKGFPETLPNEPIVTAGSTISSDFKNFLGMYCNLAPAKCAVAGVNAAAIQSFTYTTVWPKMKQLAVSMQPHNKLRPPEMCQKDGDVHQCTMAERNEGKITQATYEAYVGKYRNAFHTCALHGTAQYARSKITSMHTAGVYSMAETWLLLAAVCAWTWSYYVVKKLDDFKAEQTSTMNTELRKKYHLVGLLGILITWIMLLIKIVFHFNDYLDFDVETDLPDLSWAINLTWFLNLMFTTPAFIVVLGVIFWWWAYGRQGDVIVADIAGVPTDPDFVRGELVHAAYKGGLKFSYLMKTGPENIPRLFPTTTDKRDQWHREHWKEAQDLMLVSPTIQKLQNLAVFVQVGLDLSVISGLTFLAIACVTQAGVDDFFVIIAVFLWFFVIGLINHLSNVMRLMHVYLQYHPDALNDTHVKIVPITRTAVAILIAVMLFVYLRFAGLDTSMVSSHAELHRGLTAVLSLLILVGADLMDTVLAKCLQNYSVTERFYHFWGHVSSKARYVAWIIVISLFVMHTHRSGAVCAELTKSGVQTYQCYFAYN
jgi:hypothetical protein